jgi:putative heme-binding domain-containing protein
MKNVSSGSRRFARLGCGFAAAILAGSGASVHASNDQAMARNDAIVVRALERLPGYDWQANKQVRASVERYLAHVEGTAEQFQVVRSLAITGQEAKLARLAAREGASSLGVEIVDHLLASEAGQQAVRKALASTDSVTEAAKLCDAIGLARDEARIGLLQAALATEGDVYDVRAAAVRGLARQPVGQQWLMAEARADRLPPDVRLLMASLARKSEDAGIREEAARLFPTPAAADQQALPPIEELAQRTGDAARGEQLFRSTATCSNCHLVKGFGKSVGPDLSEIGQKLSREAMLVSVLDPNAGISHNFENWIALADSGQVITGLMISQTPDEVVIRSAEGVDYRLKRDELESLQKSEKSLMPENLHLNFDVNGLVDIVEYMTGLRTAQG